MQQIVQRASRWWWHRRDRRVARLGGRPYGDDPLPVERFEPKLHEAERVKLIEQYAARLCPDGVDEATGHPLDNLVNALTDMWISDVRMQYAAFMSRAAYRLGQAGAVAGQYETLHDHDRYRVQRLQLAMESTMYLICGDDLMPGFEGDDDDDQ